MIPGYLIFIYRQDKRLLPYLYFVCIFLLGLFWKNCGYSLSPNDAYSISAILSLIMFGFIYELKGYWAYKCAIKNIDFYYFHDRSISRYETFLSHPAIVSGCVFLLCYLIAKSCLFFFSTISALLCIAMVSPMVIYFLFWLTRHTYVKLMRQATAKKLKYKSLYSYVTFNVVIAFITSFLIVSPLATHSDFSLSEGFFSFRLMIAILIVCSLVLLVNLVFTRSSRRYSFLGRLFLKEIDFSLSKSIPFPGFYKKPTWWRLIILFVVESLWVFIISMILSQVGLNINFYGYFSLCVLPITGYFYLHVYWLWHHDYLSACDMYFRCGEIDKKNNLL